MIFYFSGTGNTRWVAERICRLLDDRLYSIADWYTDMQTQDIQPVFTFEPDEQIGFIFPVYSWGPPAIVLSFIEKMRWNGYNGNYTYFICTCGDDIGLTGSVFRQSLKQKGYPLHAGFSVFMPNTYVALPGFNIDDPAVSRHKVDQTRGRLQSIAEIIKKRMNHHFELHEGQFPWLKSHIIRPLFNRFLMTDKPFKATEACISCGRCVQVCPVGNIHLEKGRPLWSGQCTSCLSCFHHCPANAIQFGNQTKGKAQYHPSDYLGKTDSKNTTDRDR